MHVLAIRLALSQMLKRPLSRLAVIFSIAVVLLMNAFVFLLFQSFSRALFDVKSAHYYTLYLDSSVSIQKESEVLSAVKKIPGVSFAQLVSKEKFLDNLSKVAKVDVQSFDAEMVPRYVKVKLNQKADAESLKKIQGIEFIETNEKKFANFAAVLLQLRKLTLFLMFGLSTAMICILLNHFKLSSAFQAQIQQTLTMLGARKSVVVLPQLLEGFLEGALGGAMAAIVWLLYGKIFEVYLYGFFESMGYNVQSQFVISGFGYSVGLILFCIGALSGMIGSLWTTLRAAKP